MLRDVQECCVVVFLDWWCIVQSGGVSRLVAAGSVTLVAALCTETLCTGPMAAIDLVSYQVDVGTPLVHTNKGWRSATPVPVHVVERPDLLRHHSSLVPPQRTVERRRQVRSTRESSRAASRTNTGAIGTSVGLLCPSVLRDV